MDEKYHCNEYVHFEHSGVIVDVYLSAYEVTSLIVLSFVMPIRACVSVEPSSNKT